MSTGGVLSLAVCISIVASVLTGRGYGTEQERDIVLIDGERHFFATLPPTDLWGTSATETFDVQSTSNWKGYEATWEIKDNKLWLTAFSAKINGREVDSKQLFKSELPCLASWVNGPLYLANDFYGPKPSAQYIRTMRRFFFIDGALHKNENYDRDMRFHQGWLGLTLSCTDGAIVIDGIADGSPSQKCGELSVGDKILALTDTDNERIPINTMPVEKATQFLRGIVGQPVRIEFQGINSDKSKIVELTRGQYIPQSNTLKTVK
jgi:hypothetical protein